MEHKLQPTGAAFSETETALLQKLVDLRESWQQRTMSHSGLIRDLYLRLRIPNGKTVTSRGNALMTIKDTLELIADTWEEFRDDPELETIAEDLRAIESGLQELVE